MPLRISGFNIGAIDNIELKNDGSVFVTFAITEKNKRWILKDSVLLVMKPLIGAPHIKVITAVGNEELKPESILSVQISSDIDDMIAKLEPTIDKVTNIINSIDKITTYMARDDSEIKNTLLNIEKLSAKLANSKSLLTTVTGDEKATQSIIRTIHTTEDILKEVNSISKDISSITSQLDDKILNPASLSVKEVHLILQDVKQKLGALDGTVKAIGGYDKDLVNLKEQISAGITKSNDLMDKVDSFMQDEKATEVILP